jgi:hypothetical protein
VVVAHALKYTDRRDSPGHPGGVWWWAQASTWRARGNAGSSRSAARAGGTRTHSRERLSQGVSLGANLANLRGKSTRRKRQKTTFAWNFKRLSP